MKLGKALLSCLIVTAGCGSDGGAASPGGSTSGTGETFADGGSNEPVDVMSIETCTLATDEEVAAALQVPSVTHERTIDADTLDVVCTWSNPGVGFDSHQLTADVRTDANEQKLTGGADDTVLSHFTDVKNGIPNQTVPGVGDDAYFQPATGMLWVMYHNKMIVISAGNFVDGGLQDPLVPSREVALKMVGRLP